MQPDDIIDELELVIRRACRNRRGQRLGVPTDKKLLGIAKLIKEYNRLLESRNRSIGKIERNRTVSKEGVDSATTGNYYEKMSEAGT